MRTRTLLLLLVAPLGALVIAGCRDAVPDEYRPSGQITQFNNSDWAQVLSKVVTDSGYVRYDKIANNQDGVRDALFRHIALIGVVSPDNRPDLFPTDKDRLAYWINTYNALCVYAVQRHGQPSSMRDYGVVPFAIFYLDTFRCGGKGLSLDAIDKQHLGTAGDPRVYFGLNCATVSSPPLRSEPYETVKLDAQLDDQGHRFLADRRGAVREGNPVRISEIFRFHQDEFIESYKRKSGKADAGILESIQPFAANDSPVIGAKYYEFLRFDWSLNQAK